MTPSTVRSLALATLCLTAAAIAGWPTAVVPTPGAQQAVQPHPGFPLSTFSSADFSGSGNCATCHSALRDQAGADVSIDAHWRSTMMAQSAQDPLWQAKVSAEVARTPGLRGVIEAKCATCHAPMARTQAIANGSPVSLLDQGFLDPAHPLNAAAMDGVSCALCHQVQPTGLGTPASFTGGYGIDTTTNAPDRMAFGPFLAPFVQVMRNMVGFTPAHAAHVTEAGLCGSCHTLFTPTVDAAGQAVGTFPEQTPYLEWRHSEYGDGAGTDRTCQSCHMPEATGTVVISNRPGGRVLVPRQPFGQHHFVGGNAFMLQLLAAHVGELQVTASTDQLAWTAQQATQQLGSRTASLAIEEATHAGAALTFALDVRNQAGHKFPTGFPSRRAWLHVTVTDATGRVVFESGRPSADGRISGNDADEDATAVEPHYQSIDDAGQVQIYEAVMRDTDGAVTYTLLRGAAYAKDNRLLPAGFLAATASPDVAVHGDAAADHDFHGGGDRVEYRLDLGKSRGPYRVDARLLYQPVSYRFVADLRRTQSPQVERFGRYFDEADQAPSAAAIASASVP